MYLYLYKMPRKEIIGFRWGCSESKGSHSNVRICARNANSVISTSHNPDIVIIRQNYPVSLIRSYIHSV